MCGNHSNKWKQIGDGNNEDRMWSIWTEPKFAIGQRAILIQTDNGLVLWDCLTYLDDETVDFVKSKGDLKAIVISHPHYYSTHLDWAQAFDCSIYTAKDDEEWFNRTDKQGRRKLISGGTEEIIDGVTAIKIGGHFPGSLILHWENKLMIADSFVTVPVYPLCPICLV